MSAVADPTPLPEPSGARAAAATGIAPPVIDVVIPVHNEEAQLAASVRRVLDALDRLPWTYRVTIADNASTDQTSVIARRLSHEHPEVRVEHLAEKGRGRALKQAWGRSGSDVLVYMDVDLSTDLDALLPLVAPLISGHSDLAIGSRLAGSSRVQRGLKRELISRSYNLILRRTLRVGFSDAQCGFKAIRRDAARELLPLVHDQQWFFDTELLTVAERAGLRIHEVPVDWVDDPDSRVDIVRTALDDLRGVVRLGASLARGRLPLREVGERLGRVSAEAGTGRLGLQVAMFLVVGVLSTIAYAALYLGLRQVTGAMEANLLALLLTAVANTAANRRWSFGVQGPEGRLRHQLQGLAVFALGLGFTSAVLWAMPRTHPTLEVVALTGANLLVTVLRFVAMKAWIFVRPSRDTARHEQGRDARR
ncbi:bifunctional glycosyltransferase family 2/GtrA family protein [Nocardioides pocheonensis]|uniref:dolichyl-phosphate beta-glucosyltransferase n=1 Tax=Nocardioides pocheonensis TaxID=661485 RepID=A0A3N0GPS7_9ACTN|nr:bifunctional glycosyltransferase family 2/GtrA family protein [Nocardioides pocheonensis]RNM14152.1 glycosyltransferase [Nocardioides pocheonensis]